MLNGVKGS